MHWDAKDPTVGYPIVYNNVIDPTAGCPIVYYDVKGTHHEMMCPYCAVMAAEKLAFHVPLTRNMSMLL